jgi:high-affinity iron transporter
MLGVSFLVVFREGLETVLFYEALAASSGGAAGVSTLVGGLLAGAVVLAGVYGGIHYLGMRLRIGTFFAVTSAFLYWMAFKFAGDGVRELQAAGTIAETVLRGIPQSPFLQSWLGVHPFVETVVAQAILLIALAIGLGITVRRAQLGTAAESGSEREGTRRSVA